MFNQSEPMKIFQNTVILWLTNAFEIELRFWLKKKCLRFSHLANKIFIEITNALLNTRINATQSQCILIG